MGGRLRDLAVKSVWVDLQRVNTELFQGRRWSDWLASRVKQIRLQCYFNYYCNDDKVKATSGWDSGTTFGFLWWLRSDSQYNKRFNQSNCFLRPEGHVRIFFFLVIQVWFKLISVPCSWLRIWWIMRIFQDNLSKFLIYLYFYLFIYLCVKPSKQEKRCFLFLPWNFFTQNVFFPLGFTDENKNRREHF